MGHWKDWIGCAVASLVVEALWLKSFPTLIICVCRVYYLCRLQSWLEVARRWAAYKEILHGVGSFQPSWKTYAGPGPRVRLLLAPSCSALSRTVCYTHPLPSSANCVPGNTEHLSLARLMKLLLGVRSSSGLPLGYLRPPLERMKPQHSASRGYNLMCNISGECRFKLLPYARCPAKYETVCYKRTPDRSSTDSQIVFSHIHPISPCYTKRDCNPSPTAFFPIRFS